MYFSNTKQSFPDNIENDREKKTQANDNQKLIGEFTSTKSCQQTSTICDYCFHKSELLLSFLNFF